MLNDFIDFISAKIPGIISIFLLVFIMFFVGIFSNLTRLHKPVDEWE